MKFLPIFISAAFCIFFQAQVQGMAHDHTSICNAQRCEEEKAKKKCGCEEIDKKGKCTKYVQPPSYVRCNCKGLSPDETAAKEMISKFYGGEKKIKVVHQPLPYCEGRESSNGTVVMPNSSNGSKAPENSSSSKNGSSSKKIINAAVECRNKRSIQAEAAPQLIAESCVPMERNFAPSQIQPIGLQNGIVDPAPMFYAPNSDHARRFASFMGYEADERDALKYQQMMPSLEAAAPQAQATENEGTSNVFM